VRLADKDVGGMGCTIQFFCTGTGTVDVDAVGMYLSTSTRTVRYLGNWSRWGRGQASQSITQELQAPSLVPSPSALHFVMTALLTKSNMTKLSDIITCPTNPHIYMIYTVYIYNSLYADQKKKRSRAWA